MIFAGVLNIVNVNLIYAAEKVDTGGALFLVVVPWICFAIFCKSRHEETVDYKVRAPMIIFNLFSLGVLIFAVIALIGVLIGMKGASTGSVGGVSGF